jgi:hypothetical protein
LLVADFVVKGFVGAADNTTGHASTRELITHAFLLSFIEEELNGEGPVTDMMASSFFPNEANGEGPIADISGKSLLDTDFVENGFVGAAVNIRDNAGVEGFVDLFLSSFFPNELTSGK